MKKTKLLVVGGIASGATAAARARLIDEEAEIILFEKGNYISFATCGLPYYVGNEDENRKDLMPIPPESFRKRYHIDIRIYCDVTAIDRKNKRVAVKDFKTHKIYWETYDKVILASGGEPMMPSIEGIDLEGIVVLRNMPDFDRIKQSLERHQPQSAVVVGGGFIGLEMVENLVRRGIRTTIMDMADQEMLPLDPEMTNMVRTHLESRGVVCKLGKRIKGFQKDGDRLLVSVHNDQEIEGDIVILSIVGRPENRLAKEAGLDIGETGGIKVDASMKTSDPNIYAVGDAVEVRDFISGVPIISTLAGPINKQGRIAADNALGRKEVLRGTIRTSSVRVCDLSIASCGLNEKTYRGYGLPYQVSYTYSGSPSSSAPGAETMVIKLLFSPGNGKILGAQVIGKEGVDKRIDIFATAIYGGMTVFDLEDVELAYALPFSSAQDPVNIAGFVASNVIKGDMENIYAQSLADLEPKETTLLDLRSDKEIKRLGLVTEAEPIAINDLREQLQEWRSLSLYDKTSMELKRASLINEDDINSKEIREAFDRLIKKSYQAGKTLEEYLHDLPLSHEEKLAILEYQNRLDEGNLAEPEKREDKSIDPPNPVVTVESKTGGTSKWIWGVGLIGVIFLTWFGNTLWQHQKATSKTNVPAPSAESNYPWMAFNRGYFYHSQGKYKEAIATFKEAVNQRPDFAEAHLYLGYSYVQLGLYKEAIEESKEAIRIKPDFAEAYVNLGVSYSGLGQNQEGIGACKEAIRLKSDFADAHSVLSTLYLWSNNKTAALEEVKILQKLNPEQAKRLSDQINK